MIELKITEILRFTNHFNCYIYLLIADSGCIVGVGFEEFAPELYSLDLGTSLFHAIFLGVTAHIKFTADPRITGLSILNSYG